VLSYGLTTKKIYFFNNNSQTPDFFSEIYATNSKFNQLKSIRLGLSVEYNGKKFKKMNTDPIVPTSFISALNVINERKSKEVYVSLMKQHILNIKNNVNEYCEFLVTTRVNVKDYWLELNTELTKNNTYLY
jgi:predicted transcriptional regulator YheO